MSSDIPTELIGRARMLLQSGRLAEARDLYARACALNSGEMDAWLTLGTLQAATGDATAGLVSLDRALELSPGSGRVLLARAKLQLVAGDEAAASRDCTSALDRDAGLAEGWLVLGTLQLRRDEFSAAEASAQKLLTFHPGLPAGQLLLANALGGQGKAGDTASDLMARPVLVTGIPRSGTSLVAGCLHACGAWTGQTQLGNKSNPDGFFENVVIREQILKPLLLQSGADPLGVRKLPSLSELPNQPLLGGQVLQLLFMQGYDGGARWLCKEPKLTLLWPVWRLAFPWARWVIVRRRSDDIVESCLRTDFMRQHSQDPEFWEDWVRAYEQRLDILKVSGVQWREVEAAQLVSEGAASLRSLVDDLGLEWNGAKVSELIKPRHWHAPATRNAAARHSASGPVRVLVNSIPKSGTHLLGKALALMGVKEMPVRLYNSISKPGMKTEETMYRVPVGSVWPALVPIERLGDLLLQAAPGAFIQGHVPYVKRVARLLDVLNCKMVLIIRDPRAVALSHAGWVPTREYLPSYEFYRNKTADERLALAITGFRVEPDGPLELGLRRRFEHLLPWMAHPLVYTTRFEWLAGPQSGGDQEVQQRELRNIATHVGLSVTQERLMRVAEGLYGGTMTFRKGRIDRWREEFKEEHKSLIKAEMGDLIVRLGYERDDSW